MKNKVLYYYGLHKFNIFVYFVTQKSKLWEKVFFFNFDSVVRFYEHVLQILYLEKFFCRGRIHLSNTFLGCELQLSYTISMFSLNLNDRIAFDHSNQYQTLSCCNLVQCLALFFSLLRRLLTVIISRVVSTGNCQHFSFVFPFTNNYIILWSPNHDTCFNLLSDHLFLNWVGFFSLLRRLLTLIISGLWALEIVNTSLLSFHLQTTISFFDLQIMTSVLTFSLITYLGLRLGSFLSVTVMYVPWFERHLIKETEL